MMSNEGDLGLHTCLLVSFIGMGVVEYHQSGPHPSIGWYLFWICWCLYFAGQYRVVHTTNGITVEER